MARILAIDYGNKRTGLAVTDPLQIIANGLETVPTHTLLTYLKNYIQKENVEAIVVGMPKRLDNTPTDTTAAVTGLVRKLKTEFPAQQIHLVDERFTSKIAFQTMLAGGLKKKARQNKATVDMVSATIILQSYLESKAL
ncbi:Holliday junction resolvase RuvX [Adhaeribacter terreus]|uniref:Putative pre-16S rRNA nuclease n=1 Tax=Adhaeribacter terreus TaxID=529703 RepID=A0ABW0EEA7_9BACT